MTVISASLGANEMGARCSLESLVGWWHNGIGKLEPGPDESS